MEIKVYDPRKKHMVVCGNIENRIFIRKVKFPDHFCWKYKGYGIQKEAYDKIKDQVNAVVFEEQEKTFTSPISRWETDGIVDDLGNGPQRFLSTKKMKLELDNQPELWDGGD